MSWFRPNKDTKYKLVNDDEYETSDDHTLLNEEENEKENEDIVNNKYKIKNYIENIYKFLGDKYCFVSGAFVIEDDQQDLLALLQSVKNYSLKLLGTSLMYSHTKYKLSGQQIYEIHFSDKYNFILNCRCTSVDDHISRPVRNIKWYPFNTSDKKYIYLKLENYPTKTLGHLLEAKDRYGKGKKQQCVKSRREDCDKEKEDGEQCRYRSADPNKPFESYETILIEGVTHNALETYVRKGDEEFIPQVLNDYLIYNNDKNLLFEYDEATNSVSIRKEISSGGRKYTRNRNKKKKKNNKRTRNRNRNRNKKTCRYYQKI